MVLHSKPDTAHGTRYTAQPYLATRMGYMHGTVRWLSLPHAFNVDMGKWGTHAASKPHIAVALQGRGWTLNGH